MFSFKKLDVRPDGHIELIFKGRPSAFMGIEGVQPTVRTGLNAIFNEEDDIRKIHEFEDGAWEAALAAVSKYQSRLRHG